MKFKVMKTIEESKYVYCVIATINCSNKYFLTAALKLFKDLHFFRYLSEKVTSVTC